MINMLWAAAIALLTKNRFEHLIQSLM